MRSVSLDNNRQRCSERDHIENYKSHNSFREPDIYDVVMTSSSSSNEGYTKPRFKVSCFTVLSPEKLTSHKLSGQHYSITEVSGKPGEKIERPMATRNFLR